MISPIASDCWAISRPATGLPSAILAYACPGIELTSCETTIHPFFILQNLVVRALSQLHVARPDKLDPWLSPANTVDNMFIEVVVRQEPRSAHESSGMSAPRRARNRSATGLPRSAALDRDSAQRAPCRPRYSFTSSGWAR